MKVEKKFIGDDGIAYETEEQAKQADVDFAEKQKKEAETKNALSKQKKEMVAAIENAETKESQALEELKEIKEEAYKIVKEANTKAEEMIKAGYVQIDKAAEEKMNAIKAFNEKFGAYSKYYTGKEAEEKYSKIWKEFMDSFWVPWF